MVFFFLNCSVRSVALHPCKPANQGGQREESSEGTASGPLTERAGEGDSEAERWEKT